MGTSSLKRWAETPGGASGPVSGPLAEPRNDDARPGRAGRCGVPICLQGQLLNVPPFYTEIHKKQLFVPELGHQALGRSLHDLL